MGAVSGSATPPVPPAGQAEILVSPDIFDPGFAAQAIRGADVVVTVLGPSFAKRHNPRTRMISPPDLHQRLARTLIAAMSDSGAPARLISVSTEDPRPGQLRTPIVTSADGGRSPARPRADDLAAQQAP
jgi:hypothetical protein